MANAPDLYVPSLDACKAFGIQRTGAKKIDAVNLSFLKGPQFSGVKVMNPESSEPGDGAIDEVILEFIGNKPVTIKPEKDGDLVKMVLNGGKPTETLYTMRIAPSSTDWLKFGFSHEWGEGDGIMSRILDTVAGLLDSASGIINTAENLANNTARKKITLDKQDTYMKTDKVSFKIPFILFSSGKGSKPGINPIDQWVNDVYAPLITITAWSHPKRVLEVVTTKKDKDGNAVKITTGDDPNKTSQQVATNDATKKQEEPGAQEQLVNLLSSYPGMRVAISEPPSYVRVRHSSGFFTYNVCAITNFSYSFRGPWVKAHSLVDDLTKITDQQKQLLDLTIPMVAECELEIKVVEKMYADDWIAMFENSPLLNTKDSSGAVQKNGIVSVLKKPYGG